MTGRVLLCRYMPATNKLGRRVQVSDLNFSNTYGEGLLENKYGVGNEDSYQYVHLCHSAATQFMKDRYPDWLRMKIYFLHGILKIRGTEVDTFTVVSHRTIETRDFMPLCPELED